MRVLMATNTYLPHVGGVANLVSGFKRQLSKLGHRVMVIAPGDARTNSVVVDDDDVVRVPAISGVGGTDFSLPLATRSDLQDIVLDFSPHIIHSHHPFALGNVAADLARVSKRPIVYGYNTLYEHYTQNFGITKKVSSTKAKLGASLLAYATARTLPVVYANTCAAVLVPTTSVARLCAERGARVPIYISPYGVDCETISRADGSAVRRSAGASRDTVVIGHVGRLSNEKNLPFLARSMASAMRFVPSSVAVIVGKGPCEAEMRQAFASAGVIDRVLFLGVRRGQDLAESYAAMDLFCFASTSETQGMVLAEAMSSGAPVIALNGPGTRDIVAHGRNGALVNDMSEAAFVRTLVEWMKKSKAERDVASAEARRTSALYSPESTTERLVCIYRDVISRRLARPV